MKKRHATVKVEQDAGIAGLVVLAGFSVLSVGYDLLSKHLQHRKVEKMLKRAQDAGLHVATYNHELGGIHYRFFTENRYYFQGGEIYTAHEFKEANDFLNGYEKRGPVTVA
jgi:hypothetical protein